jgi:hypothetical protein
VGFSEPTPVIQDHHSNSSTGDNSGSFVVLTSGCLLPVVSCTSWCLGVLRALLLFHLGDTSIVGVVLTPGFLPSSVVVCCCGAYRPASLVASWRAFVVICTGELNSLVHSCYLVISMLRPSIVDCIAGLFCIVVASLCCRSHCGTLSYLGWDSVPVYQSYCCTGVYRSVVKPIGFISCWGYASIGCRI